MKRITSTLQWAIALAVLVSIAFTSCDSLYQSREPDLYNSYVEFKEDFYPIKDTCFYSSAYMGPEFEKITLLNFLSPVTSKDTVLIAVRIMADLSAEESLTDIIGSELDIYPFDSFRNVSIRVGDFKGIYNYLTDAEVYIHSMDDSIKLDVMGILNSGDSLKISLNGIPLNLNI